MNTLSYLFVQLYRLCFKIYKKEEDTQYTNMKPDEIVKAIEKK